MPDALLFLPSFFAHSLNTCLSVLVMAWPYLKVGNPSKLKLTLLAAVGCVYGAVCFGQAWQTGDVSLYFTPRTYFLKVLALVVGFFAMKYILQADFWQAFFISCIMGQYVAGVTAVATDFLYCLTGSPAAFQVTWLHLGAQTLLFALTLPFILLMLSKIAPIITFDTQVVHWHWLCLIPLLFGIIFNAKFYRGGFLTYGRGSWYDLCLALAWFAATFSAYVSVLHSLRRAVQSTQLKEQLHLLQIQADMHREQNARLCEYADDVRRTQHDLRHHFVALKGLADDGDCAGIRGYLETWNPTVDTRQVMACANPALEAVLNYYLSRAVALGAQIDGKVALPAVLGTAESDVCMIVGNLTENAVEALQRQTTGEKHLHVDAKLTAERLLTLRVTNSCDTPPQYRDGALLSAKRDSLGIGTASVDAVAQQRQGFARYKAAGNTFTAFVCMNIGPQSQTLIAKE